MGEIGRGGVRKIHWDASVLNVYSVISDEIPGTIQRPYLNVLDGGRNHRSHTKTLRVSFTAVASITWFLVQLVVLVKNVLASPPITIPYLPPSFLEVVPCQDAEPH